MNELEWGQLGAFALGMLFLALEYIRLRRLRWAALEAFRLWGYMAMSALTIWLALHIPDVAGRVGLALVSPIVAALVINNMYLLLHRRLSRESAA